MRCPRPLKRRTISSAVFRRLNSPKYSSMYWISRAPCSRSYWVIRYSTPSALLLFFDLGPGVAKRHDAIEHPRIGPGVVVDTEIPEPLELHVGWTAGLPE